MIKKVQQPLFEDYSVLKVASVEREICGYWEETEWKMKEKKFKKMN